MNCTNCGTKIEEADVNFCPNCGANLSEQQVVSQTPVTATPAQAVIVTDPAQVLPKRDTQRTVIIACLILIALVVLAVTGIFLWKVLGSKELLLDADTIKDDALRNTLTVEYDKDGDGKLSEDELDQVQTLELDAGDSYDFLNLFINLDNVTVKNTEVSELDLSQNKNLKSANFKDATNLKTLKLPDMSNYNNVFLPDNAQFELELPDNSEYEVKYVPKKVEETTFYNSQQRNGAKPTTTTTTYTQDVKSATRISGLTYQDQTGTEQKITYKYDDSGRIISWGQTSKIEYDDNGQVKNESAKINGTSGNMTATYDGAGKVTDVSDVADVKNDNGVIYLETSGLARIGGYWKYDGDKLNESFVHIGSNAVYFAKSTYNWDGEYAKSLTLSVINEDTEGVAMSLSSVDACSDMPARSSEDIALEYDSGRLTKATYESGFAQGFEYDSNGNLVRVTSTGTPKTQFLSLTTDCSIEYASVIGKKNSEALNFLTLPGLDKKGLYNCALNVRGITLCSSVSQYTAFTQDFSGKFWWDEENIVNAQVEAASQGDSDSSQEETESEKIERLTKQLNDEGYDTVVTGELRRHVDASSYGTNIIYFVRTSSPCSVAAHYIMSKELMTKETDTFRLSSAEDAEYSGMAGHQVVMGFNSDGDKNYWQSDTGCSLAGHTASECDFLSGGHPLCIDDAKLIDLES